MPQHVDPEVARFPFNGYKRAIKESALVGKAVPGEAPVKLHGFCLKETHKIEMSRRSTMLTSSGERRETLRSQQERRCSRIETMAR